MMHPRPLFSLVGFCFLLAGIPLAAVAAPPTIQSVSVGFEGEYRPGYWSPVRIEVHGGSEPFAGQLEVIAPDGDGVSARFVTAGETDFRLDAGATRSVIRLAKLGRSAGIVRVELRDASGVVAQAAFATTELARPVHPERRLIAVFGGSLPVGEVGGNRSRFAASLSVCELQSASQFPDHWLGLESIDTLFLSTTNAALLQELTDVQLQAIEEWILNGGRLVWSVGRNGDALFGQNGRFSRFLPGRFVQTDRLRNVSALETFTGSAQRLETTTDATGAIALTVVADVEGRVELAESTATARPLVIRTPRGFGQILFVAVDLNAPPIADWEGQSRMITRFLQGSAGQADRRPQSESADLSRFGYQDMVGQLRSGLDQFPEVTFVPFSWIAGLVLLYIIAIVPLDYFLVRDILRRMTFTWITFPVATIVFIAIAVGLGNRWKGNELLLNQVDLVDVDFSSGYLRGTSWAHLYSPRAAAFDIQAEVVDELSPIMKPTGKVLAWQGLPGTGLGGLNTAAAAPPAINEYQIVLEPPSRGESESQSIAVHMEGIPVHVAATKSLLERWWGTAELNGESSLTTDADGLLRGELLNPLPIPLEECVVYFENWAYRLDSQRGVLDPGESTRIEYEKALNLQWRMTGRRVIETKDRSTPWDQNTLVVPQIMEMMMFHETAGGENYTRLVNQYHHYVDLSSHIASGRAILIGRSERPAMTLVLNQKPQAADRQWTYYRIAFPVAPYERR